MRLFDLLCDLHLAPCAAIEVAIGLREGADLHLVLLVFESNYRTSGDQFLML